MFARPRRHSFLTPCLALLAGCSLVSSSGLQTDYSFDALEYTSPAFGDPSTSATVPQIACDPAAAVDECAAAASGLQQPQIVFSCDATLRACVATAEIRVSETVDISKQMESSFPPQAIQFGVEVVEVKRLTYWINKNSVNTATPMIEFYVAPAAALDETDPQATLLASIASVAAESTVCRDQAYANGDPKANGAPVCSATLPDAGKNALAGFVKDYKTPFQVIAHARIVAKPGEPIPSGQIGFAARPTVGLKILN